MMAIGDDADTEFVSDLLVSAEHAGSLPFLLEKTGLGTEIRVEIKSAVGIAFFSISCSLTFEGAVNVDHVISLIFQVEYEYTSPLARSTILLV